MYANIQIRNYQFIAEIFNLVLTNLTEGKRKWIIQLKPNTSKKILTFSPTEIRGKIWEFTEFYHNQMYI